MQDSVHKKQQGVSESSNNTISDWFRGQAKKIDGRLNGLKNLDPDKITVQDINEDLSRLNDGLRIFNQHFSVKFRNNIETNLRPLLDDAIGDLRNYNYWLKETESGNRFSPKENRAYMDYLQQATRKIEKIVSFLQSV